MTDQIPRSSRVLDPTPVTITYYALEDGREAAEAQLPEPYATRLAEILEAVDCYGGCWNCGDAIGLVLNDDDDLSYGLRGVYWRAAYLVREGDGPVAAVCESCSPLAPTKPYPRKTVVGEAGGMP